MLKTPRTVTPRGEDGEIIHNPFCPALAAIGDGEFLLVCHWERAVFSYFHEANYPQDNESIISVGAE